MRSSVLDELRLVLAALQAPERHELDPRLDDEHLAQPLADPLGERGVRVAPRASSTRTGSGGSCFTPGAGGPDADVAADRGRESRARPRGPPTGRR